MWWLVFFFLFAGAHAQVTSPTNVLRPTLNVTATSVWQACGGGTFADESISIADLLAQCPGRVMFGCYAVNATTGFDPALLYGAVATDHATFQFGGTFNDSTTGLPVYVLSTSLLIYGGNSSTGVACANTTDGTCLDVSGGFLATTGYCPGMGYISNNTLIGRIFYSDPCSGLSEGASCAGVFGLCGSGAVCSNQSICVNSTLSRVSNSSCTLYSCQPSTGNFVANALPDGTLCPNENFCTATSACLSGNCVPQTPYTCASGNPCLLSAGCNYTSQACEFTPAPTTTLCSSENGCYPSTYCDGAGTCPTPVEYPPPTTNGGCMVGITCNNATGEWTYGPGVEGAPCDYGDPCFPYAVCTVSGFSTLVCSGVIAKNCTPPTDCYTNVGCFNGGCSYSQKPTGTACTLNDPCFSNTGCTASGSCVGIPVITCPASTIPCTVYVREATSPTTCGCVLHNAPAGSACAAGTGACAVPGTCDGMGGCSSTTPRQCPGDDCNAPTTCDSVTGCTNAINDGGSCNAQCRIAGTCYSGSCTLGVLNTSNPYCNMFSGAHRAASLWTGLF